MPENVATFNARARTIDHLGRGQIADIPTAVTELWKNAYDAYAKNVSLHIFEGNPEIAAIFDDGFGMNRKDFLERWLVIGTESKISERVYSEEERFGLPERPSLGEKGIGRLSAAFIAPVTLVVSKKKGERYACVLVDWRFFENPYISLQDVIIPVEEFDTPEEFSALFPLMINTLKRNLNPIEVSSEKTDLLSNWNRFSYLEEIEGKEHTTFELLKRGQEYSADVTGCLSEWLVFAGLEEHGTAIVMIGAQEELASFVRVGTPDESTKLAEDNLRETLTAFTDPLSETRISFDYEVLLHKRQKVVPLLGTNDVFGFDDLMLLEHVVYGNFDEKGVFTGKVIAFGKDRGTFIFAPDFPLSKDLRGRVGPFDFCIGTFEMNLTSSTHPSNMHSKLLQNTEQFAGIYVYRDSLRVMPYGRHNADFFEIEERRAKHAGREFWSYRRAFGRVGLSAKRNPNLKDKAGREGLVDNRAKRDLYLLVKRLLMNLAREYFGTNSSIRENELPEIIKRNAQASAAAERARIRRRTNLRSFLKDKSSEINEALNIAKKATDEIMAAVEKESIEHIEGRVQDLLERKTSLRPPPAPEKADEALLQKYREYRDKYNELSADIDLLAGLSTDKEAEFGTAAPEEAAKQFFYSRQSRLNARVEGYISKLKKRLDEVNEGWQKRGEGDRSRYYRENIELLNQGTAEIELSKLLNMMDTNYRALDEEYSIRYEAYLAALDQLGEGIDLDGALASSDIELIRLQDHVEKVNAVAQLGISVEILGHELDTLDAEIRRNLKRLPEEVRTTTAFKLASSSAAALTDRLRFLTPMKIAGYRSLETITGEGIVKYLRDFFGNRLSADRIDFTATAAFRNIALHDYGFRIYPTFINLINNAAYWVTRSSERKILLDFIGGKVVVADTGPGVDPDDVPELFTLFFTRKPRGRGVGLYLVKANLSVAGHKIRYASEDDPHPLLGANFIIEFKGVDL